MARYRKKPIIIEAVQWLGNNRLEISEFTTGPSPTGLGGSTFKNGSEHLRIHTLEGVMEAAPGDWIIRGVKGEFYPCKPDIFEMTYEAVDG